MPLDPIQSLIQCQKCCKAKQLQSMRANAASLNMASPFPPQPPSSVLLDNIIQGFSNNIKLDFIKLFGYLFF